MLIFWGALVVFTGWLPKLRVGGENVAAASKPVPLRGMLALEFPPTERVPLSPPRMVGVKVTLMEQLAPTASEVPQLLVCAKSPEEVTVETEKVTWPLFVKVTD